MRRSSKYSAASIRRRRTAHNQPECLPTLLPESLPTFTGIRNKDRITLKVIVLRAIADVFFKIITP